MDAELQAIPWMDQPAPAPVGSAFCEYYPERARRSEHFRRLRVKGIDLLAGSG